MPILTPGPMHPGEGSFTVVSAEDMNSVLASSSSSSSSSSSKFIDVGEEAHCEEAGPGGRGASALTNITFACKYIADEQTIVSNALASNLSVLLFYCRDVIGPCLESAQRDTPLIDVEERDSRVCMVDVRDGILDHRCNEFLSTSFPEIIMRDLERMNLALGTNISEVDIISKEEDRARLVEFLSEEIILKASESSSSSSSPGEESGLEDKPQEGKEQENSPYDDLDVICARIDRVFTALSSDKACPYNPRSDESLKDLISSSLSSKQQEEEDHQDDDDDDEVKSILDRVVQSSSSSSSLVEWSSHNLSPFEIPGLSDDFHLIDEEE